jgi:hypothetical protein
MGKLITFPFWVTIWSVLLNPISAKVVVDPTYNTCGQYGFTAAQLLAQTQYMANNAIYDMDKSTEWIRTNTWEFYKVWTLFDTYFDDNDSGLQDRWKTVRGQEMPNKPWLHC